MVCKRLLSVKMDKNISVFIFNLCQIRMLEYEKFKKKRGIERPFKCHVNETNVNCEIKKKVLSYVYF